MYIRFFIINNKNVPIKKMNVLPPKIPVSAKYCKISLAASPGGK
jgi:hypothetical protein